MAEIRFNYGDKFTQTSDSNTGIGSTIPAAKLDIAGGTSAGSLRVSGIATLSSYQGFVNTKFTSTDNITVDAGQSGSVSGEVVVSTGQTTSVSTGATTGQGGIQSLKVYETFMPPVGGTADRPTDVKPGMVYYNKDFKTIEFWDGNFWRQVDNTTTSGRALFGASFQINTIDFINMHTLGNALSFGDSLFGAQGRGGCSSNTRGLWAGGYGNTGSGYLTNNIDYVTLASEGNAIDFGDINTSTSNKYAHASSTRGVWPGGASATNVIDYVEIGTLGNALDFGDLSEAKQLAGTTSSPVRGVIGGGSAPTVTDTVEFITIASKGNGIDFGKLSNKRTMAGGLSDGSRAVFASGSTPSYNIKTIDYFDIMTGGSSINFGEMSVAKGWCGTTSSKTRGIIAGGLNPTYQNLIEFITISSAGDTQDFGDLTVPRHMGGAVSDCHGGLGGF